MRRIVLSVSIKYFLVGTICEFNTMACLVNTKSIAYGELSGELELLLQAVLDKGEYFIGYGGGGSCYHKVINLT